MLRTAITLGSLALIGFQGHFAFAESCTSKQVEQGCRTESYECDRPTHYTCNRCVCRSENVTSSDSAVSVSFSCDNFSALETRTQVSGVVKGPISQDWSDPNSANAEVSLKISGSNEDAVSMNGILLGTRQYRDPQSGKWVYVPMRTFLQGRSQSGRELNGGFYFGLGRKSLLNIDKDSVQLTCDFVDPQPLPNPTTPSPQPQPCRQECRYVGGGHDGPRRVCRTVCGPISQPRGPQR